MLEKNNIPKHIAIIMDGNGRWAKEKGLPRSAGHREGIQRVKEIIQAAAELGVSIVTFFAFSTENWARPKREVDMLMRSLNNFLAREVSTLMKKNIRFLTIGREEPMPEYLLEKIKETENKTRNNTGLTLVLAFNYGSRQEIVDAVKKFSRQVKDGGQDIEELDVESFSRYLYTADLAEPDLLIRTSGEQRISNFLLWQLSYAELYFPKKNWPDFGKEDLKKAVEIYQNRERRFGRLKH